MNNYMVVAKFKNEATQADIKELIPAEMAQAKILEDKGLLGEIRVSMPKRTVFLEAIGQNEYEVSSMINTLPLASLWDFEIFQTTPPAGQTS